MINREIVWNFLSEKFVVLLIFRGNIDFSCGVNLDPTLVLTPWIRTLGLQGLIVQMWLSRNVEYFKSKLTYILHDDYYLAISLLILLVKHIDFNINGCQNRSGIIKFHNNNQYACAGEGDWRRRERGGEVWIGLNTLCFSNRSSDLTSTPS